MTDLNGQIALVSGASRGIGKAIADALSRAGAQVVGTATSERGAESISAHFQEMGANGLGRVLDVNSNESIEALMSDLAAGPGSPTILVNNAGITRDSLLMRMGEEDWQAVIDTNLRSVYRLSRAAVRPMVKARYGRIVNIASVVASMGNPGQCNYAAAKAGMIGFGKALALEVAQRGVTVNAVAPGFIETDMTADLSDSIKSTLLQRVPAARFGAVEEVAAAVTFLCSPAAAYITGETIHVNGGMYLA